jgi:hypothetical protein
MKRQYFSWRSSDNFSVPDDVLARGGGRYGAVEERRGGGGRGRRSFTGGGGGVVAGAAATRCRPPLDPLPSAARPAAGRQLDPASGSPAGKAGVAAATGSRRRGAFCPSEQLRGCPVLISAVAAGAGARPALWCRSRVPQPVAKPQPHVAGAGARTLQGSAGGRPGVAGAAGACPESDSNRPARVENHRLQGKRRGETSPQSGRREPPSS